MSRRRIYDDPRWKEIRLHVLGRDGSRCQIAGPKCKGAATHVDHIVSVSDGGAKFDPGNLRAACASCNISKRSREVAERARGVRAGEVASIGTVWASYGTTPAGHRRGIDWTPEEQRGDTGYDT